MSLRRVFELTLFWFLAVSTFFYCPVPQGQDPIEWGYVSQELFVRYGIILLFALSLMMKPLRNGLLKEPGFFLAYVLFFSVFMSFDIQMRRSILNIFMGLVFYKLILDYFDFKNFKGACWTMFLIVLLNVIFCGFQYFRHDPLFTHAFPQNVGVGAIPPVGLMRLQAHLGTLAALLAPWLYYINPLYVLLCLPLLYFGFSSFAVGAFIVSMSFLLFFRVKRPVFILSILVLLALGAFYVVKFDMPTGTFDYRFKVWFIGIKEMLPRGPFFGLGIGSWARMAIETAQQTNSQNLAWVWAHNEYVQAFVETGAVGFMVILYWLKSFFSSFKKIKNYREAQVLFASVLSLLIISIGHFPFHLGRFSALSVFILAMFQALKDYIGENNEKDSFHNSLFQHF